MRLDALLSESGLGSRAKVHQYIKAGRVSVGGEIQRNFSIKIPDGALVTFDGKEINTDKYIYLMMNKPAGYVCTTDNTEDSVMHLIPKEFMKKGLSPAGRLDKDSKGLLLLSNDGDFIHRIISPKKHMVKVYKAELRESISGEDEKAFLDGIKLSDGTLCLPAVLRRGKTDKEAFVELIEGKYHQVRRMFASRGNHVKMLTRLSIGEYSIDGLEEGQVVKIQEKEVSAL